MPVGSRAQGRITRNVRNMRISQNITEYTRNMEYQDILENLENTARRKSRMEILD